MPPEEAIAQMRGEPSEYDATLIDALDGLVVASEDPEVATVEIGDLAQGMILADDLRGTDGLIVAAEGQEITPPVLKRLQRLCRVKWLEGSAQVRAPVAAPS